MKPILHFAEVGQEEADCTQRLFPADVMPGPRPILVVIRPKGFSVRHSYLFPSPDTYPDRDTIGIERCYRCAHILTRNKLVDFDA